MDSFFFSTLGSQTKRQVNPIVKKNIEWEECGEVPPSLVHLHLTESPRVSHFLQRRKAKKESQDVTKTGLELDTPVVDPALNGDDGHSSLI